MGHGRKKRKKSQFRAFLVFHISLDFCILFSFRSYQVPHSTKSHLRSNKPQNKTNKSTAKPTQAKFPFQSQSDQEENHYASRQAIKYSCSSKSTSPRHLSFCRVAACLLHSAVICKCQASLLLFVFVFRFLFCPV